MAVPKKKTSRSRRNMRRFAGGNRLEKPTTITCPTCNEPTRPHRVCMCGYYDKKLILNPKIKTKEKSTTQNQ
ncbi:MAG: 50S ribosomal protein L32 [Deltaproteobacteria bacterium]|nr:50S ribosomal protein L32 [Deltaproteobacteria bacterium]